MGMKVEFRNNRDSNVRPAGFAIVPAECIRRELKNENPPLCPQNPCEIFLHCKEHWRRLVTSLVIKFTLLERRKNSVTAKMRQLKCR